MRTIDADILLEISLGEGDGEHAVSDMNFVIGMNRIFASFDCVFEGVAYNVILRMTIERNLVVLECEAPHNEGHPWWDYAGYRIDRIKAKKPRRKDLGFKFYINYIQKVLYRVRSWVDDPKNLKAITAWKRSWQFRVN